MTHFRAALRDHALLFLVCGIYAGIVLAEALAYGAPAREILTAIESFGALIFSCILFFILAMGAFLFLQALLKPDGKKGIFARLGHAIEKTDAAAGAWFRGRQFAYGCAASLIFFEKCFFFIQKSLIRFINPYHWDPAFAVWDKALHFGRYPHTFIIPLVDAFRAGPLLEISYLLWFPVMYGAIIYNAFLDKDPQRRMRFLWALAMAWILLGSVMATAFSSVGPAFYAALYPGLPDVYADLTAYLDGRKEELSLAWQTRQALLQWSSSTQVINVNALSAMPSMHVAIAWLITLYFRTIHKGAFWALAAFSLAILLGSVYLGFHYAIDGYVSIVVISLFWWAAGKISTRLTPKSAP